MVKFFFLICVCVSRSQEARSLLSGVYAYISLYLYLYNDLVRSCIGPELVSPVRSAFQPHSSEWSLGAVGLEGVCSATSI